MTTYPPINFPTDTTELSSVATDDLLPIYDVSAPGDLKEVQAVNVAKTVINDTSTGTDRVWSASKVNSYSASISGTQTLTNKTIDADNNTISNLEVDNLKTGVLDTDLTSVAGTDTTIPSAKATKTALDTKVNNTGNETIAGIKTFSSFPVTPSSSPSSSYEVVNKIYVDTGISSAIGIKAVLSSDFTTTNNTLQDVTGLGLALESGATYQYTLWAIIQSNGTSITEGYGFACRFSGTKTFHVYDIVTPNISPTVTQKTDESNTTITNVGANDTNYYYKIEGTVKTTSAGTLYPQLLSEIYGVTVRYVTGSTLHAIKIG